jgi:hypothetical protein
VVDDCHLAARRKVRMVRRPLAGRWQSMAVWWRYLSISRSFFYCHCKRVIIRVNLYFSVWTYPNFSLSWTFGMAMEREREI